MSSQLSNFYVLTCRIVYSTLNLSYNPILKGNSGPKLKAEISFISEYQMQASLEF
jgi:hypothetical protein